MDKENKMNILVVGPSGAGKSTLIKAISGKEVHIGIGEGQTERIDVYESDIWPLTLIDTKGFEYSIVEKIKTINQVRKYTRKQISKENGVGIDAVWYCVDGMTGRVFFDNIKSMSKAIKGWNAIPIFAIITKSIVETNIEANIRAVKEAFLKSKKMNLKNIIPIVAEEYDVGGNTVVPFGIEKLCSETLDCYEEAKNISIKNKNTMILNQKRFTSHAITGGYILGALTVGVMPIPSSPVLVPLEISLIESIFKVYNVKLEKSLLKSAVTSGAISVVGKSIAEQAVKMIPGVSLIYGVVAAVIVTSLGESTIAVSEGIYNGKIDPNKVDNIINIISEGLKNNPLIESLNSYLSENKNKIDDKLSSKDIFEEIIKKSKNK